MWGKSGQIYPTFRCIKWIIFYCFCISCFKHWTFHDWSILYTSYGSRTSTRQGRGNTMGFTPGQNNGVTQRVTKQGETTRKWEMSRLYLVIWIICGFIGYVGYLWLLSTILYIYICFSTITFQTFSGSFSRHRSLKETSIWLTDLQVSVSVQIGTFQKIANNIYIMEMPILGLMIPKKNAAVCNGMTIVLYEMEGATWHQNLRVFCPVFQDGPCMKWCWFFHFIRGMGSSIPYRYSQGGCNLYMLGQSWLPPVNCKANVLLQCLLPLSNWTNQTMFTEQSKPLSTFQLSKMTP